MTIAPTEPIAPDEKTQEFYVDALRTLDERGYVREVCPEGKGRGRKPKAGLQNSPGRG